MSADNNDNVNDGEMVSEWVDSNVTTGESIDVSDDSVTDCCCGKRRITIDNGNWAFKLPLKNLTVKETVDFCSALLKLLDYLPSFDYNYDGWHNLEESIKQYKANSLLILEEHKCLKFDETHDVDFEGNDI